MSTTASQSDSCGPESENENYAPEGVPFVDWSEFNENRWKYVGETQPLPESDITDVDANNETIIRYDKIADINKRKRFKWLSEHNTGLRNGEWINQGYLTHELNEHLIGALTGQLDLNPRYQQEATGLFMSLNLGRFGVNAGIVAYCVCAVVVHQTEDNKRNCHPSSRDIDPIFERIAECEGYRQKDLISIYNKIAQTKEKYQG
jgi:hypothetical protein